MVRLLTLHALAAMAGLLVACGGLAPAGSSSSPAGGGTSTPGASSTGNGSGATNGSSRPGYGAGGGVSNPCLLLTEAEVAGGSHLLDTDLPLTVTNSGTDPAYCEFTLSDKTPILKLAVQKTNAARDYQTRSSQSGDPASGIGDQATYQGDGHLLFLAGDYFVDLNAYSLGTYYTHGDYYQTRTDVDKTILVAKIIESRLLTGSVPAALEITAPPKLQAHSACELLPADEAAGILGKGKLVATANEATPNFCYYTTASDGMSVFSTYYKPYDGQKAYASEEETLTADAVSGFGDKAMYDSFDQALHVLKGDSEVVVTVTDFDLSADDAKALAQKLAVKALTHL